MFYKKKVNDNYSTPVAYLKVIEPYIPKDYIINDPFYFNGLVQSNWRQIGRDIIHEDKDFFTSTHEGDIFVSNPPFSNLKEIFIKLFELEKPFILLLPIQKIAQLKLQKIIKDKNLQMIISPIYMGFINSDGEQTRCSSQYFAYVCWKMNLERDLMFITET
tara:strand:- start:1217 stop:1699 length:483 start_codon:yes stop_codon:yes gene_type:complete